MKPSLTFLVCSQHGDATALAEVGRRRANDLGLHAEIVALDNTQAAGLTTGAECVVVIVPVEFAVAQHEAWCLLCQLSLLRSGIGFTILVLGATGSAEFQKRQLALRASATATPAPRRRRPAA